MKNALILWLSFLLPLSGAAPIQDVTALRAALAAEGERREITLAPGTFVLDEALVIPAGTSLRGAGADKTIITHAESWRGNPKTLPDPETNFKKFDKSGYLLLLADKAHDISLSGLTLTGPGLHGAIYGWGNHRLHLKELTIRDFLYAGLRTYATEFAKIEHCTFIDAGQRWERGQPGLKGGITGGGIFVIWIKDSEIAHNRFLRTKSAPNEHYYGIKGRQGKRLRIHHNTIETNFSIEFPFENDEDVEIAHNILHGTVSIPKHAGGPVPESGRTFHIHHNWFRDSYAIEFVRNGVEIDHNFFDFSLEKDHGNLISAFGKAPAKGPASFHHNLVVKPGRGVIWMNEPYANLRIHNNHIIARETATPRREGLFGFSKDCDFASFEIRDNLIEIHGPARPLFRNDESAKALISNNELRNVSDTDRYDNPVAERPIGLGAPLDFRCGVNGEITIKNQTATPSP
ncbi:MAG: right-handed parallel beta-helix repeat-containing protein [Verrucomicrobiales bacterium]